MSQHPGIFTYIFGSDQNFDKLDTKNFHSISSSFFILFFQTSSTDPLKLPIPGQILEIILNYIYADNAPFINDCQDIELLCNTLTTADQLLMTRLKEMCEAALADMSK